MKSIAAATTIFAACILSVAIPTCFGHGSRHERDASENSAELSLDRQKDPNEPKMMCSAAASSEDEAYRANLMNHLALTGDSEASRTARQVAKLQAENFQILRQIGNEHELNNKVKKSYKKIYQVGSAVDHPLKQRSPQRQMAHRKDHPDGFANSGHVIARRSVLLNQLHEPSSENHAATLGRFKRWSNRDGIFRSLAESRFKRRIYRSEEEDQQPGHLAMQNFQHRSRQQRRAPIRPLYSRFVNYYGYIFAPAKQAALRRSVYHAVPNFANQYQRQGGWDSDNYDFSWSDTNGDDPGGAES